MAKVYVKLDSNNCITTIDSDMSLSSTVGYICIDEGEGSKYIRAQVEYLEKGLRDMQYRYNYKYENNKVVELTEDDKKVLYPPKVQAPIDHERIEMLENVINSILKEDIDSYQYLLDQWILRKVDKTYLQIMVNKGRITQEQCDKIIATPQMTVQ